MHSDSGSQYHANAYHQHLTKAGIVASMSRRGNCYELAFSRHLRETQSSHNAPIESFRGSLKNQLIHQQSYPTRQAAIDDIVEYVDIFYNQMRRHTSLGNISPAQALQQFEQYQRNSEAI